MTWAERIATAVGWPGSPFEVDRGAVEEAVGVRLPDDDVVKTADGVDDSLPNGFAQFPTSASEFLWRIRFDHELAPLGAALAGGLAFEPDDGPGGP